MRARVLLGCRHHWSDVLIGSGAPPGGSTSAKRFCEVFHKAVDGWVVAYMQSFLWATYLNLGITAVGLTTYADSIANKTKAEIEALFLYAIKYGDRALDAQLREYGLTQKDGKEVVIQSFCGAGFA